MERQALFQSNMKRAVGGPQPQTGRREKQSHIHLAVSQWKVSPIPADRPIPAQFPLQAETKMVDLKMPIISLLSKHTYFRMEDTWNQLN